MQLKTHVMFQGQADAALSLYRSVFDTFELLVQERYGPDEPLPEGDIKLAEARLGGHQLIIYSSPPVHDFDFTPSVSLYVDFDSADALDAAFAALSDGGKILMPAGDYGFSTRYGWVLDRFGLSWQLSLPHPT